MKTSEAVLLFDSDLDGKLNEKEAVLALNSLGIWFNQAEENEWLNSLDFINGFCTAEKLTASLEELRKTQNPKVKLVELFKKFDRDGKGSINKLEFYEILKTIGELLNEEERKSLVNLAANGEKIDIYALANILTD